MINMVVIDHPVGDQRVDVHIIGVQESIGLIEQLGSLPNSVQKTVYAVVQKQHFIAKAYEILTVPTVYENQVCTYILMGLGTLNEHGAIALETYRRSLAKAVRAASSQKASSIVVTIPHQSFSFSPLWPKLCSLQELVEHTAIIIRMTLYHFDTYITMATQSNIIDTVILVVANGLLAQAQKGLDKGKCIADAVNKARWWVDTPPSDMTPETLAHHAQDIAQEYGLGVTVFGEKEVIAMGMGGLAAVSRGSSVDCQMVILEYKTATPNAPTLAFVGKGITFDSGGLSIKPAQSMEAMKDDMSGAAAVIVTMQALAQLKPAINIVALAPLSENLPSGTATKPGDVVRFYNGKTAEIKNTDAEGRLVLADALSYAVKHYKLDAIIDIATLTGACAYALGPFYTGLMSHHTALADMLLCAGERTGDYTWRLPMSNDYKKAIQSTIADICNIGDSRIKAGAITAAHFLHNFVDDVPWVHLDIAGTAFDVPNIPYYGPGATGVGVRLLIELACSWHRTT